MIAAGPPLRQSEGNGDAPSLPASVRGDSSEAAVGEGLATCLQLRPEQGDAAEDSILKSVAAGTASKEDLLALGTILWRKLHPSR